MNIFEIIKPGTWLDYEDKKWAWEIGRQIDLLERQFFQANTALLLFTQAMESSRPIRDRAQRERDSQRRSEISRELERGRNRALSFNEMRDSYLVS